jgi:lysozyme
MLLTLLAGAVLLFAFWHLFIRPELTRPTYGSEAYHVRIPDGYAVHGIDISHHQGDIDWDKLQPLQQAAVPIRFVFVKATEGGDHVDRRFDDNFAAAREHGFLRGAYHFYNPATDPIVQADFFISHVTLEKGDLPPVIDVEKVPSRIEQQTFYAQLSQFLYRLEAHYGVRPVIYTFLKYRERYLDYPEFNRYPLWIAHYHVPQPAYEGKWVFWQHTDRAVLPGIEEKTDLNVFQGTLKDLQSMTIP